MNHIHSFFQDDESDEDETEPLLAALSLSPIGRRTRSKATKSTSRGEKSKPSKSVKKRAKSEPKKAAQKEEKDNIPVRTLFNYFILNYLIIIFYLNSLLLQRLPVLLEQSMPLPKKNTSRK